MSAPKVYYVEEILSRWATQAVCYESLDRAEFHAKNAKDCAEAVIWAVQMDRSGDSVEIARYRRGRSALAEASK